jgi:hypothetical protein
MGGDDRQQQRHCFQQVPAVATIFRDCCSHAHKGEGGIDGDVGTWPEQRTAWDGAEWKAEAEPKGRGLRARVEEISTAASRSMGGPPCAAHENARTAGRAATQECATKPPQ